MRPWAMRAVARGWSVLTPLLAGREPPPTDAVPSGAAPSGARRALARAALIADEVARGRDALRAERLRGIRAGLALAPGHPELSLRAVELSDIAGGPGAAWEGLDFAGAFDPQTVRALARLLHRREGADALERRLDALRDGPGDPARKGIVLAQILGDLHDPRADAAWEGILRECGDAPDVAGARLDALVAGGRWIAADRFAREYGLELPPKVSELAARYADTLSPETYLPGRQIGEMIAHVGATRDDAPPTGKRVVLVNASLGLGGAERQFVNTALGLARARPDLKVEVWVRTLEATAERNALLPELRAGGVEARAIMAFPDDPRPLARRWPDLDWAGLRATRPDLAGLTARLFNAARRDPPAVMHLWQDATISEMGLGALAGGAERVVLSLRSLPPPAKGKDRPLYRPAMSAVARAPGVALAANSRAGADGYADYLGVEGARIAVVPNACLPAEAADASRTDILGVMRLDANKRPLLWLAVVAEAIARRPGTTARLYGGGPMEAAVRARAAETGLEDAVEVMGPDPRARAAMAGARALLHVPVVEGLPNTLIEAQWAGCPVVATDAGGAREAFVPGRSGTLIEDEDEAAIQRSAVEALLGLLGDDALRDSQSRTARAFARERFGMDAMIARTLALYGLSTP